MALGMELELMSEAVWNENHIIFETETDTKP